MHRILGLTGYIGPITLTLTNLSFFSGHFLRESYWWGKFIGIDLCSELVSELDGRRIDARRVKGVVLGEGAAGLLPTSYGSGKRCCELPQSSNGVRC